MTLAAALFSQGMVLIFLAIGLGGTAGIMADSRHQRTARRMGWAAGILTLVALVLFSAGIWVEVEL